MTKEKIILLVFVNIEYAMCIMLQHRYNAFVSAYILSFILGVFDFWYIKTVLPKGELDENNN